PASRILGRLVNVVGEIERRAEEVAPLRRIALRTVEEVRVAEHLAAELTAPQPAGVEIIQREVVPNAHGPARIRRTNELAVGVDRGIRDVGHETRDVLAGGVVRLRAGEVLDSLVHADELGREERSDRLPLHDDLRILVRLSLTVHESGVVVQATGLRVGSERLGNRVTLTGSGRVSNAGHLVALA